MFLNILERYADFILDLQSKFTTTPSQVVTLQWFRKHAKKSLKRIIDVHRSKKRLLLSSGTDQERVAIVYSIVAMATV